MHSIAVVSSFIALVVASSVYDAPPFQSRCNNITIDQFNLKGFCDNGTPWWTSTSTWWGTCVGLDATNKLVCEDGCVQV